MKQSAGRSLFGIAAIGFGICALAWHTYAGWQPIKPFADLPHGAVITDIVGCIQIVAGIAVQWPASARAGGAVLGAIYLAFALSGVSLIIAQPLVYNGFGNFFEQLSFVSTALILFARSRRLARFGYYTFGVCVLSFALEQLFYLSQTANLVPSWIPPSQMFWAIATTVAFGAAAVALLTGLRALLASGLTAAMVLIFGVLVWMPALVADPHRFFRWSESFETLGIAASA
ncbi:MAG TPA: hypothetical protein VIK27_04705, partial [Candidatus Aquilonibacter sp.]